METLGTALVAFAALFAGLAAGSGLLAAGRPWLAAPARHALHAATLLLAAAVLGLAHAFLGHDVTLRYVVEHSDRATPLGYLLAGVWAGQDGSLLLWAALVAAALSVFVEARGRVGGEPGEAGRATALAALLVLAFAAIALLHSNPFRPMLRSHPVDGLGLNGLLRNPLMVVHPPVLFAGFAAVLAPAVLAARALVRGERDVAWVVAARPWALAGWGLLGLGNVLGMLWSYEELGWGGYWGWDPVENASLLPWLASTAYLHTATTAERRGALLRTAALLAFSTAILPVLGTYLTRSGIVASQHAFAETPAADAFLLLVTALSASAAGLLAWRWRRWGRGAPRIATVASREAGAMLTALLLVAMLLAVAAATLAPLLGRWFLGGPIQVQAEGYVRFMGPLALVLLLLTAVCPTLAYRRTSGRRFVSAIGVPAAAALAAVLLQLAVGSRVGLGPTEGGRLHGYPVLVLPLAVFVVVSVVLDVVRALRARVREAGEPWPVAARWLVAAGRRRLGGQVAHLGAALMLAGFAGASYQQTGQGMLQPAVATGDAAPATLVVGGYRLTYLGARDAATDEYEETQAVVRVDEPDGAAYLALPSLRRYRSGMVRETAEVAIRAGMVEDLYVEVRQFRGPGAAPAAFVRAHVNPLTFFIWTGALLLLAGTLLGLWPMRTGTGGTTVARRRSGAAYVAFAVGLAAVAALWKGAAPAALAATGAVLLAALWEGGRAAWGWAAPAPTPDEGAKGSDEAALGTGDPDGAGGAAGGARDDDTAVDRLLGRWEEP
ncbi:MAG: cytochrome c biogenesis protein CcsA [Deltaproteobacteria bacterium]|nr:cytochrome c biogenesis protein CcsA [Deltaproteobacteria bacterium]